MSRDLRTAPSSSTSNHNVLSLIPQCNLPRMTVNYRSCGVGVSEKLLVLANCHHPRVKGKSLDGPTTEISRDMVFRHDKLPSNSDKVDSGVQTDDTEKSDLREDHFINHELFPDLTTEDTEHIFANCNQNIHWAANVILDAAFHFDVSTKKETRTTIQIRDANTSRLEVDKPGVGSNLVINRNGTETTRNDKKDACVNNSTTSSESVVSFELDPVFADQLQDLFGLYSEDEYIPADLLYPEQLKVDLPLELAKEIHKHWLLTLKMKSHSFPVVPNCSESSTADQPKIEAAVSLDEATAIAMQAMEDEESARLLAEEEQKNESALMSDSGTLATKLKRQKLKESFPSVSSSVLEDIFVANQYKFDPTVEVMKAYGHEVQFATHSSDYNRDKYYANKSASYCDEYNSVTSVSYNELRKEAQLHGEARKECFRKARDAYRNNQAAAAHYYSSQGHKHNQELKEANARAERLLLEQRRKTNPSGTLDLHGLHVPEAVRALSSFLREHDRPLDQRSSGQGKKLTVITGQGKHSLRGPKIKPAIIGFLNQRKYKYEEITGGVLNVFCK